MWNPFARLSNSLTAGQSSAVEIHAPAGAPAACHDMATLDRIGPITIVTITRSELTQQHGGAEFADMLEELLSVGHTYLVFDIQNVAFMDSCCVGYMVEALNHLARRGGAIALANAGSSVAHLFRITRLDRVFPICNDVLAAINVLERMIQCKNREG